MITLRQMPMCSNNMCCSCLMSGMSGGWS